MNAIGVVGGYGSVGAETVAQLRAWGWDRIVVAGRDPARVGCAARHRAAGHRASGSAPPPGWSSTAPRPSRGAGRWWRTAAAGGVPYVDPGGDERSTSCCRASPRGAGPVVLSAGHVARPDRLAAAPARAPSGRSARGLRGRSGPVLSRCGRRLPGGGERVGGPTFAVWRERVPGRASRRPRHRGRGSVLLRAGERRAVPEPGDGTAGASPHLGAELDFLHGLPRRSLRETLAAARTGTVDAEAVVRASELDLFGRTQYQRLVFQLRGDPAMPTAGPDGQGFQRVDRSDGGDDRTGRPRGHGRHRACTSPPTCSIPSGRQRLRTADAVTELRTFEAGPVARMRPAEGGSSTRRGGGRGRGRAMNVAQRPALCERCVAAVRPSRPLARPALPAFPHAGGSACSSLPGAAAAGHGRADRRAVPRRLDRLREPCISECTACRRRRRGLRTRDGRPRRAASPCWVTAWVPWWRSRPRCAWRRWASDRSSRSCPAIPHRPSAPEPLTEFSDQAFIGELRRLGATPAALIEEPRYVRRAHRTAQRLRAVARYEPSPGRLTTPIVGLVGDDDPDVAPDDMRPWTDVTPGP
jgi:hypothetical protein